MGLGYVGLPLALEFVRAGYRVVGLDSDNCRVRDLKEGKSHILDVSAQCLVEGLGTNRLEFACDPRVLAEVDTVSICVPTPLGKTGDPDLSFVQSAFESIRRHRRRGQLYVLESTTYPGATEEIVLPVLSEGGWQVGEDFYLAFSPERVDPGNERYTTRNIPKVVGGVTQNCADCACALYENAVVQIVRVASAKVAEMVKLLENTFRSVNIALVNEMTKICHTLGLDVWEVIEAAKTKPFGFMPFYPGPGLGGHCLPVDPIYLSWKARQAGFEANLIELADEVNNSMPRFVVDLTSKALNKMGKTIKGARILLAGVTYKADVTDIRGSPALDVWTLLERHGASVLYSDPHVPDIDAPRIKAFSQPVNAESLRGYDCVVVLVNHKSLDKECIHAHANCIVDTRNAFADFGQNALLFKL
ncbi:MAG: nucleotide sugar dehydrogenase [Nitrospinae bacterium]|nr:nucleotide sugar dehydrogenase [Nitrospinota bacterium]